MKTIIIPFQNYTNEQLVNWIMQESHMVSNISESNDLMDAKEELLSRLNDLQKGNPH